MKLRWFVPMVWFCVAAAPTPPASYDEDLAQRRARVKSMFVGQPACKPDDRKACTKSCTNASFKTYRYDTAGAADCEAVGDIWALGLGDVKKAMPEVGYKSYAGACFMGQATACEKEAAYLDGIGNVKKGFEVRLVACEKGYMPACLTAADSLEKHKIEGYTASVYAVKGHVDACDERKVAESCAWLDANPELAKARREEVAAARAKEVATITSSSGSVKISAVTQVEPLLETHQVVFVTHPESQKDTGELVGKTCYEVWIPTAADKDLALAAAFADSLVRRKLTVDPALLVRIPWSPRHPQAGCSGEIVQISVN